MNRDELRKLATQHNISGRGAMNKAQLIEVLSALTRNKAPVPGNTQNRLTNKHRKHQRALRRSRYR